MSLPTEPAGGPAPAEVVPAPALQRNTVTDTWRWLWKDTAFRLVPFAAATGLYAWLWGGGPRGVGLIASTVPRDVLVGVALGLPLAALAAAFRRVVAPGYRLPTAADQAFQSLFYLALNAPVEELFWRGVVQTVAIRGAGLVLGTGGLASGLGWAACTAVFGVYHRLGNWSWRAIAGVTAAGGVFGLSYLLQPAPQSIWLPTIIHGFATAGFLSWGDVALHWWARRRGKMPAR
jgi:membrane protease YdiL (CAAX protease family)